jgi:hypothetical protein
LEQSDDLTNRAVYLVPATPDRNVKGRRSIDIAGIAFIHGSSLTAAWQIRGGPATRRVKSGNYLQRAPDPAQKVTPRTARGRFIDNLSAIELCCPPGDRVRIVAHDNANGSDTVVVHSRAARHTDRLTHPVLSK